MRYARNGYVTYLLDPERHTNAANSYPGLGATPTLSRNSALYWANQLPWTHTVRFDRAPRWAREAAARAALEAEAFARAVELERDRARARPSSLRNIRRK
jgi:hypothetical protein